MINGRSPHASKKHSETALFWKIGLPALGLATAFFALIFLPVFMVGGAGTSGGNTGDVHFTGVGISDSVPEEYRADVPRAGTICPHGATNDKTGPALRDGHTATEDPTWSYDTEVSVEANDGAKSTIYRDQPRVTNRACRRAPRLVDNRRAPGRHSGDEDVRYELVEYPEMQTAGLEPAETITTIHFNEAADADVGRWAGTITVALTGPHGEREITVNVTAKAIEEGAGSVREGGRSAPAPAGSASPPIIGHPAAPLAAAAVWLEAETTTRTGPHRERGLRRHRNLRCRP